MRPSESIFVRLATPNMIYVCSFFRIRRFGLLIDFDS